MDFNLNITKLDKKQFFMLGITVAIAMLAAFYQFYYVPSQQVITALRQEIAAKDSEMSSTLTKVSLIHKLEKEIPELDKQIATLGLKTASSAEIIPLISTIEEEAQRLDLKVLNMVTNVQKPVRPDEQAAKKAKGAAPEQETDYTRIFITVSLQGRYKKIEGFIRTLQNIAPFLIIDEANITSDEEIYPELRARLILKAYSKDGEELNVIAGKI